MPVDVFVLPFGLTQTYWGMSASAVPHYSSAFCTREAPKTSLFVLLLTHPWRSSKRIIVVHWATELYGSRYALKSIVLLIVNMFSLFLLKTLCACTVVHVVHNNAAHDYPHPHIDKLGQRLLMAIADVLVAQQKETEQHLVATYPHKKVVYIPHTNFVGAYGQPLVRTQELRARFGFAADDIVLLSFGSVRPYKKIERFIDMLAAQGANRDLRIKLWIVGKGDKTYIDKLQKRAEGFDWVRIDEGFVKDAELPAYFAAADYALFYFDESELTSGSLLLALSYGLPVITRAIAGAEQVRAGINGYLFTNDNELTRILASLPPAPPQTQVVASLQGTDYPSIERRYSELYTSLI